jgi:hypothetical protein
MIVVPVHIDLRVLIAHHRDHVIQAAKDGLVDYYGGLQLRLWWGVKLLDAQFTLERTFELNDTAVAGLGVAEQQVSI